MVGRTWFGATVIALGFVSAACGGGTAPPPARPVASGPRASAPPPATGKLPPQPLPAACEAYLVASRMLIACEKTPQGTRDALQKELDLITADWNKDGDGPSQDELRELIEACTSGTEAINKSAIDMGC